MSAKKKPQRTEDRREPKMLASTRAILREFAPPARHTKGAVRASRRRMAEEIARLRGGVAVGGTSSACGAEGATHSAVASPEKLAEATPAATIVGDALLWARLKQLPGLSPNGVSVNHDAYCSLEEKMTLRGGVSPDDRDNAEVREIMRLAKDALWCLREVLRRGTEDHER